MCIHEVGWSHTTPVGLVILKVHGHEVTGFLFSKVLIVDCCRP